MTDVRASELPAAKSDRFWDQPRGLAYLVFTEAWERFSFYGMQALLVLYMSGFLLHPGQIEHVVGFSIFRRGMEGLFGHLSTDAMAMQLFGLYGGLTYLMPVFGGLAGDLFIGRRRAVILGAIVMASGHFMMAFEQTFLFALLALVTGCGLLKGNIAAQVGALYAQSDQRRDRGFSLYYIGINVGAFVAPLVCGTLGEFWGWDIGFASAGVGMLVGLCIYLAGLKYIPADTESLDARHDSVGIGSREIGVMAALFVMLIVAILFWTAQSQVWNAYPLWIRDHVDRHIFAWEIPITWFQSIDSMAVLLLAPVVMHIWRLQSARAREPNDLVKIAIGCSIFGLACCWLALGQTLAGTHRVPALWAVLFHCISAWGYLYFAPVALALFTRAGPERLSAMMVAIYYVSLFVGSVFSGWLGRFYGVIPVTHFWLIHAAIAFGGGLTPILLYRPLARAFSLSRKQDAIAA